MRTFRKVVVAFFTASLCLGVQAAEKPPVNQTPKQRAKAPVKPRGMLLNYEQSIRISQLVTDEMKANYLKFMELRQSLLVQLTDSNCKYQAGGVVCLVQVPVYLLTNPSEPGKVYCAAAFPKLITLPRTNGNPEKTIVWYLDPQFAVPTGAKFTFYQEPDHGIIVLNDKDHQMRGGELGDGTQAPGADPDPTKYLFRHKNNKPNAVSVYLPIVVRTDNEGMPSEEVSVCGTPDPRIAND
jgi:hypothetical protein